MHSMKGNQGGMQGQGAGMGQMRSHSSGHQGQNMGHGGMHGQGGHHQGRQNYNRGQGHNNYQGGHRPNNMGQQQRQPPAPSQPMPQPQTSNMPMPTPSQQPQVQFQPSQDPQAGELYRRVMPIYNAIDQINPNYKNQVGTTIFDFVHRQVGNDFAPKITGMLIDLPIPEIQRYLTNWEHFVNRVQQAHQMLLQQTAAGQQ